MKETIQPSQSTVSKKQLLILSIVTLALSLFNPIVTFLNPLDILPVLIESNAYPLYTEVAKLSIINIIFSLIQPLPAILLLICVIRNRSKKLLCIAFASVIVLPFVEIITNLSYGLETLVSLHTLLNLSLIVTFTLATINAAKGFSKTASLKIAGCIFLLVPTANLITLFMNLNFCLEDRLYFMLIGSVISVAADVLFIITLFAVAFRRKYALTAPLSHPSAPAEIK